MTDFKIYRNSPEIESVKLTILQKAEKPLKPVWPFASFLIPWKKLGNLGMFYGLYKTLDKTYDSTAEKRKRLLPKGQSGLKVAAKYLIKKLPGYLLKPLMEGSKLERQLSNTGLLSVLALRQNTLNASTIERAVIDKVLREKFADQLHVDYNDFRKAVLDELITYSRVPLTKFEDYGIDRLKYGEPMDPAGLSVDGYKDVDRLKTFTFESPRIPYGNTRHYHGSTLGHVRTFTTRKEPNILYVLENQSDWGLSKFKEDYPRHLTPKQEFTHDNNVISRLERYVPEKFKAEYNKLIKDREQYGNDFPEIVQDLYSEEFKDFVNDNLGSRMNFPAGDAIAKWYKKYFPINSQIKYLHDNYSQRQLQESLKYASENGLTKMRYPTRETAAKIEGYKQEALPRPTREKEIALRDLLDLMWKEYYDANEEDLRSKPFLALNSIGREKIPGYAKLQDELDLLRSIPDKYDFLPLHQTILRKYSEFPKQFKKLYPDQEVRTVTDSKGNTWYEVDIPNGYLQREWPFKHGGKIKKHLINK